MRRIIVYTFITLDGVMQGPGSPEEDPSGGFQYGGWIAPYSDEESGKLLQEQMQPADLLLGRKTFEIWETYWPRHADSWPGINDVKKYVFSNTIESSDWSHSVFLKHVDDIRKLKNTSGSDIKVWGSSQLVQLLLENGLVDEFWLMIHPIVLGKGKKLFSETAIPAAFTLVRHLVTPAGVIFANYRQEGAVVTGNAGE